MSWTVAPVGWRRYRELHLAPPSELLQVLRGAGIHNYSIYAWGTRVFATFETDNEDWMSVFAAIDETEVKRRWDAAVTKYIVPGVGGSRFEELEEIFRCD